MSSETNAISAQEHGENDPSYPAKVERLEGECSNVKLCNRIELSFSCRGVIDLGQVFDVTFRWRGYSMHLCRFH